MLCELLSVDIALLITLLLITLSIINVRQFVFAHFAKLQRTNTLSDKVIVSLFIPLSHHMYKNLATKTNTCHVYIQFPGIREELQEGVWQCFDFILG